MMKRITTDRNGRRFHNGDFLLQSTGNWYKVTTDPRPMAARLDTVAVDRVKVSPNSETMIQIADPTIGYIIPAFTVAFSRAELVAMLEADALVRFDEVTYEEEEGEDNE